MPDESLIKALENGVFPEEPFKQQPTDGEIMFKALGKLAGSEAFTTPFAISDNAEGRELQARIQFAREAIAAAIEQSDT